MQRKLGILAVALGLTVAVPLAGCVSRPAPRREGTGAGFTGADINGALDAPLSERVASTARGVTGAGTADVIVIGNGALVAMQLNSPTPSGGVSASPARLGGQISPSAPPGGTPNYTQAVPDAMGDHATQNLGSNAPAPIPGAVGSMPLEVMTRVADQIRAKNPAIVEVRFAIQPDDARRVADLAAALRTGGASVNAGEVKALWIRAQPAGTELFHPQHPPQGTYPPSR